MKIFLYWFLLCFFTSSKELELLSNGIKDQRNKVMFGAKGWYITFATNFFLNITNYLNEPPFRQTVVKRDAISQSGLIQSKKEISMAKLFVSSIFLLSELMDFLSRFRCNVWCSIRCQSCIALHLFPKHSPIKGIAAVPLDVLHQWRMHEWSHGRGRTANDHHDLSCATIDQP